MGLIQHNCVVATTSSEERIAQMREWIRKLSQFEKEDIRSAGRLFAEINGFTNGYVTFILAPDGSKEGWSTSNAGDRLRNAFIARLDEYWDWIEVSYGEIGQRVVRGNCDTY